MADPKGNNGHSGFHVGMRKVKSLLSIFIGFVIWQLVRLIFPDLEVPPVFVYIYAVLEIRDTSDKTRTLGLQRIKATLVAMLVGLPMLFVRIGLRSQVENGYLCTAFPVLPGWNTICWALCCSCLRI